MPDPGDALLFTLSAWKDTNWPAFKKAFDELHVKRLSRMGVESGPARHERSRAAQLLESLGHCDVDFSGDSPRLYAAPSALAALPTAGVPSAILCGARSPDTADTLRRECTRLGRTAKVDVRPQYSRYAYAPARIEVEGESEDALVALAGALGIRYLPEPPAWSMVMLSPSLDDYLDSLTWSSEPEINWPRFDFRPDELRFAPPTDGTRDLRLSRYLDPSRWRTVYRLWRDREGADVDPTWGRYAVLRSAGRRALSYDNGAVVAPLNVPLPRLMARALTLCSGWVRESPPPESEQLRAPVEPDAVRYAGVPRDVFTELSARIGQDAPEDVPALKENEQ